MTQYQIFTDVEQSILDRFHSRCVKCYSQAVTIHEIEPRSHGKESMREENRVPLCAVCHDWAHRVGTSISIPILKERREEALKHYA